MADWVVVNSYSLLLPALSSLSKNGTLPLSALRWVHMTYFLPMKWVSDVHNLQNKVIRINTWVCQFLFFSYHPKNSNVSYRPPKGQKHNWPVTMLWHQWKRSIYFSQPLRFRDCLLAQHNLTNTDGYRSWQTMAHGSNYSATYFCKLIVLEHSHTELLNYCL